MNAVCYGVTLVTVVSQDFLLRLLPLLPKFLVFRIVPTADLCWTFAEGAGWRGSRVGRRDYGYRDPVTLFGDVHWGFRSVTVLPSVTLTIQHYPRLSSPTSLHTNSNKSNYGNTRERSNVHAVNLSYRSCNRALPDSRLEQHASIIRLFRPRPGARYTEQRNALRRRA